MEIWDHSYRWLDAPAGRTILVGDLHGCYSELLTLLERLDFSPRDLLLAVGDLLDRGPESWELARFFRETPNAHSVLGNHERKVVKVMQGAVEPAWSQTQTLSRLPEDQWPRWSEWLCSLPLIIETPDVVVAHARIDPERSLREQETRHVTGVGGPGLKIARDCDDVPTWYAALSADKPVCIGHLIYTRVELVPRGLYALDTDAVTGGRLTALVLPGYNIMSMPVAIDHKAHSRECWQRDQRAARLHEDPMAWPIDWILGAHAQSASALADADIIRERADTAIQQMQLGPRLAKLRRGLIECFGDLPASGPLLGVYNRTLKAALPPALAALGVKVVGTPEAEDRPFLILNAGRASQRMTRSSTTLAEYSSLVSALQAFLDGDPSSSSPESVSDDKPRS